MASENILKIGICLFIATAGLLASTRGDEAKPAVFAKIKGDVIELRVRNSGTKDIYLSDPEKYAVIVSFVADGLTSSFPTIQNKQSPVWKHLVLLAPFSEELPWEGEYKFSLKYARAEKRKMSSLKISLWLADEESFSRNNMLSLKLKEFDVNIVK